MRGQHRSPWRINTHVHINIFSEEILYAQQDAQQQQDAGPEPDGGEPPPQDDSGSNKSKDSDDDVIDADFEEIKKED